MGNLYADVLANYNDKTIARSSNITAATTVEGNKVVWVIYSAAAAYDLTVAEYDSSRVAQYKYLDEQPTIIIKCVANCSLNNVTVKSSNGAGSTTSHYVFASDYSVTPRYIALRLSATEGADGTRLWELA